MTPKQLIESLQTKIPPELMNIDIILITLDDELNQKHDLLAYTGIIKVKGKSCVVLGSQDNLMELHELGKIKNI